MVAVSFEGSFSWDTLYYYLTSLKRAEKIDQLLSSVFVATQSLKI